jgi:hypothetical protein
MIQHVYRDDFVAAFKAIRPDNFTLSGLNALFDHFEQIEEGTGEPITLDVIGICCQYTQYDSIDQFNEDYGEDYVDWDALVDAGVTAVIRLEYPSGATWKEGAIIWNF